MKLNMIIPILAALLIISGCTGGGSVDERRHAEDGRPPHSTEEGRQISDGGQTQVPDEERQEDSAEREREDGAPSPHLPPRTPEAIADDLDVPWSIEKSGNTFYVTERPGTIVKIENGEVERQTVELARPPATDAEAGLLGFALAADFADSRLAYAYYSYEDRSEIRNRIVVLRLDGGIWREERALLDRIPGAPIHNGGRLKFGPDGKLYATTGDAADADIAQDLRSLGGKILRMNPDGSIPDDNPFPNSYVYSYGHRNPQGLVWLPDGTMYASEHGQRANDEINRIEPGRNYGWPIMEGLEEREGMVAPLFTSGDGTTWAPSGMDDADGKLYVAALRGNALMEFDPETGEQRNVVTNLGRIRDVLIEDHVVYFISNNTDGRGLPQRNDDKLYHMLLPE